MFNSTYNYKGNLANAGYQSLKNNFQAEFPYMTTKDNKLNTLINKQVDLTRTEASIFDLDLQDKYQKSLNILQYSYIAAGIDLESKLAVNQIRQLHQGMDLARQAELNNLHAKQDDYVASIQAARRQNRINQRNEKIGVISTLLGGFTQLQMAAR